MNDQKLDWKLVLGSWNFARKAPWLSELGVFIIMLVAYLSFQMSHSFADPDSFYHLKIAELIAAHGPVREFLWMPYTTLANSFADQHFLYHVALVPFIKILGSFTGMKVATATLAALAIAAIAWSLRTMGVRYAAAFALAVGVMNPFAFRIGLSKASAPGVALLMIGLALAAKRRAWPLGIITFIYVWTHGSWPALVGLGTIMIIITSWDGKIRSTFHLLRSSLLALWLGAVLGVIINPFFPQNLKFYWEQIVQIAVVNYQGTIGVGAEWYPYETLRLVNDLPLLCLFTVVALIIFPIALTQSEVNGRQRQARLAIALSVCALAFLILTLRSQRHVEYFVPLAVAAAAAWITLLRIDNLRAFLWKNRIAFAIVAAGSLMMFAAFAGRGLAKARRDLVGGYGFMLYQKAAEYLKANTEPNEIILHADWDDMPPLFYWDDKNRYIMGLDPTFLYRTDPDRYWRYVNFTLGKSADPVGVMKELGARYVFSDLVHKDLDKMLKASGKFTLVYLDEEAEIYQLK